MKIKLLALSVFAALMLSSGAARAEDKKVDEPVKVGEKSRTGYFNEDGKKTMLDIVYADGRSRREIYNAWIGRLTFVRDQFSQGWQRTESYNEDGTLRAEEIFRAYNGKWWKMYSATHQKDGSLLINWFSTYAGKLEYSAIVSATGEVFRFGVGDDGVPLGAMTRGRREKLAGGTVKFTWYEDDGKTISKTEEYLKDHRYRRTYYRDGKISLECLHNTPVWLSYSDWSDETHYKNGVRWSSREKQTDGGLILSLYGADGKTLLYRQSWRNEPRQPNSDRVTNYLLKSIEDYNGDGTVKRRLVFDVAGKNVRAVHYLKNGVAEQIKYLRNDATNRVNGTVEKVEHFNGTTLLKTETFTEKDSVREKIEPGQLNDPVFGEDEPGKMRIRR